MYTNYNQETKLKNEMVHSIISLKRKIGKWKLTPYERVNWYHIMNILQ
jgi:hypothetical protein